MRARRQLDISAVALTFLVACGGGDGSSLRFTPSLAPWTVPSITLAPGASFDLHKTLPIGTPAGGRFTVSAETLPAGVSLTAEGVLTVAANASPASNTGIRFGYEF
jgi:hypothetical protein